MDLWTRFKRLLAKPVSGASLAAFRVAVGLVMALEAYSLWHPSAMASGTIPLETYYTGTDIKFNFPYHGFEWLPLLPSHWINIVVGILAMAGMTMACGLFYRVSAATVFLAWGYLFTVESTKTYFQSYYYIELLATFLLVWMPAAQNYSVDAWLARARPSPRTVPFWTLLLLRGQLLIAYFYAGVAKLNADWLLDAAPLRWVLREAHVVGRFAPYLSAPQLAHLQSILHSTQFAYAISYLGVIFDLSIGFLLLIRRTRLLAMVLMAIFHAVNHFVIYDNIDWFPLLGVTTALIFLEADWPERLWTWLRRPRLTRPDWGWFIAGAILIPGAGALLGWKCKAGRSREAAQGPAESGRWAAPFIVGWLLSQTLLPIRHYFIPGDARITHEGLSFSWRLKTDEHHASAVQFFVKDMKIISHENSDPPRINWNEWHGDRTIYRTVVPGRIHWSQLPEILVLFEPIIGERVIYNPAATADRVRTEAESRERAARLWQELYGRQPRAMRRTIPLFQALDSVAESLQTGGKVTEAAQLTAFVSRARQLEQNAPGSPEAGQLRADARKVLDGLYHRGEGGGMRSLMRSLDPFALEEGQRPVPFLVVEDPEVCDASSSEPVRVNRAAWKDGPFTRGKRVPSVENLGGEPLIVYLGNVGAEAREMLPSACVFDSEDYPERFAYIWWNTLKDVTNSKLNHISNQPFYLVRYARRVAGLWEKEYQRRPVVNAITAVSLNRRPYQLIVDPEADLASVPITWLGHNVWIRDLETQRIPREVLLNN